MTRIIHCLKADVTDVSKLHELNFFKPGDLVITTWCGKKHSHFIYKATFERIKVLTLYPKKKHSIQNTIGAFSLPFTIYRVMEE